jgi:nucleoside-diphosphate-sugar epimerase
VTARKLVDRGVDRVIVVSRRGDTGTLALWFGDRPIDRIEVVKADLTDPSIAGDLLSRYDPSHVIHLAGLQSPDCDADPQRGLAVNVGGTLSLVGHLERQKRSKVARLVFASSGAVYGQRTEYPAKVIAESDPLLAPNLYGVWKIAGEHLARLYQRRTGVPTVSLRLNTTYGLGRDRGRTSAATTALKALALAYQNGQAVEYSMPYHGRENYHFVEDVGAHFAGCALDPFDGYGVFNIRGETIEVREYLDLVREAAVDLGMGAAVGLGIADGAPESIFSCDLDERAIRASFPELPKTPLPEGIRRSLIAFGELARLGKLMGTE